MITGDLDRAVASAAGSAGRWDPGCGGTAPFRLPATWRPVSAGTWRPGPADGEAAPTGGVGVPGTYTTTVAFRLARLCEGRPAEIAGVLAGSLTALDWVASATVSGGFLTVTVTGDALAALAVRIPQAGLACARGDSMRGVTLTAPRSPGLASASGWQEAHERLARHLSGVLAAAVGATVLWAGHDERLAEAALPAATGPGAVADAVAFAGLDAVTFALCRMRPGATACVDPVRAATHHMRNPAYAVRYAHAHAASTLRQAADLGLGWADAAGFQPRLLAHPSERTLLGELSWLPERVGGAARRGRPDVFARYLEGLAKAYFASQESCPAVWPGMRDGLRPQVAGRAVPGGAGDGPAGSQVLPVAGPRPVRPGRRPPWPATAAQATTARLWLVAAARTALAAGLSLLGVDAPDRL